MIKSDGKNQFKNNEFLYWEWSAPVLQTYEEIVDKLRELRLEGRVVKNVYCIGMAYNWREDNIVDAIYNTLSDMTSWQRNSLPNFRAFLPEGVYIHRLAEIDEPFLIEFEDGDILAIDYSEGSSVRLELNTIPKTLGAGCNYPNIHPDALFDNIIGCEITSVEITTSLTMPEFTGSHGLLLNEQPSYINGLSIFYKTTEHSCPQASLFFTSELDYGIVALKERDGATMKIHAPNIKRVVNGYVNEELLNCQDNLDADCFDPK